MSGHSKWAGIKHKKAKVDAQRGKVFTKLIREITMAARQGGSGDPGMNPRLRTAIATAKAANMPADNIERAVKKGTGELPGVNYEEITYEGYGPAGVAVLVEVVTDNRNRTASEIRALFGKHGGNLGEVGCVSWMFNKKGYITVEAKKTDEETLMAVALDAGAEDMKLDEDGEFFEIFTAPPDLEKVKEAVLKAGIEVTVAQLDMIPQSYIKLEGKAAQQMLKLMEVLEDQDDTQNVYANFDIPAQVMAAMAG